MGLAKKGKRKIVVDGCEYFWYVSDDLEVMDLGTDKSLTIITENKEFLVRYPVNQKGPGHNLLIILGKKFGGNGNWGGKWKRIASPRWEIGDKITPASVKKLILWAHSEKTIRFVDSQGNTIPNE